jgi:photosystem II stability/assembly factor-like uncharacterized protein
VYYGYVYLSRDAGTTWSQLDVAGSGQPDFYSQAAASADGTKLAIRWVSRPFSSCMRHQVNAASVGAILYFAAVDCMTVVCSTESLGVHHQRRTTVSVQARER